MVDSYYPIIVGIITGELVSNISLFVQTLSCVQFFLYIVGTGEVVEGTEWLRFKAILNAFK